MDTALLLRLGGVNALETATTQSINFRVTKIIEEDGGPLQIALLITGNPIARQLQERSTAISPAINASFADPSILYNDADSIWYAFATDKDGGPNVQVASSSSVDGPWNLLSNDLLPAPVSWSNGALVWAPDVRIVNSKYVLYYSATSANSTSQHCVGAATSDTILGPYTAEDTAIACNLTAGGPIDPSGYTDSDGKVYVVSKVDGNGVGNGGTCGNTVAPIVPTPIMFRELDATDGVAPVNDPVQILDREDSDGPLIEAPNIIKVNHVYFLFSSNCYSTPDYDTSYAYSSSLTGPYTRSSSPLWKTGDPFDLTAPGGATATEHGTYMVFHADCGAGRCMHETSISIQGNGVMVEGSVKDIVRMSLTLGGGSRLFREVYIYLMASRGFCT